MEVTAAPWSRAQFCAAVAAAADLVELLREEHPAYAQCSAAEVSRRRGWILVELGKAALEDRAIPFVLEELETGHVPYLLAAAARALRRAEMPAAAFAPAVLRALEALVRRDDLVDLRQWGGMASSHDAACGLDEVLVTLRWLGEHARGIRDGLSRVLAGPTVLAEKVRVDLEDVIRTLPEDSSDCCGVSLDWRRFVPRASAARIDGVRFEDQDGAIVTWDEWFAGQPTIAAFFYTRCDNELKCSLTIAKLAEVQRRLHACGLADSVRIAAVSYDPDFDLPDRLRGYAQSRGLVPGAQCRVLRAIDGRDALQGYFSSGVNFVGSSVNRHRIEVFVLDAQGAIAATWQRLSWQPEEVVAEAERVRRDRVRAAAGVGPVLWAIVLALLPKCPICGATYLSLTGLAALPLLPGWAGAWPLVALLLLLNVAALGWLGRQRKTWGPLAWSACGAVLILGPGLAMGYDAAMVAGVVATAMGSLMAVTAAPTSRSRTPRDAARPRSRALAAVPAPPR